METISKAPGKIILFGEHAVVYGVSGISAAVGMGTTVKISESDNYILTDKKKDTTIEEIMNVKNRLEKYIKNGEFEKITKFNKFYNPYFYCRAYVAGTLFEMADARPFKITTDSELRKGMGRSAAIFVALADALGRFLGIKLSKNEINEIAFNAEKVAHGGTPSGIDNNTVVYGGYILFNKKYGAKHLDIKNKLDIVIADSGVNSSTGKLVSMVRKLRKEKKSVKDAIESVEKITEEAVSAIKKNNKQKLGKLMNENHEILKRLKVSTPELEELVNTAINAGAYGAKLSGAGGGGIMITLAKNAKEVSEAIKKKGYDAFITKMGVQGISIQQP